MKILHIIVGLEQGGAEKVLLDVLKYFPDNNVEHLVVSMTGRGVLAEDIECMGIPVFALGMPSFSAIMSLREILKSFSPDIVQGWMYHGNFMASIAKLFNKEIVLFWAIHHSLSDIANEKLLTKFLIKFGSFLSDFTDRIIYVSSKSATQHKAIGYNADKTKVIPNGVDISKFKIMKNNAIREELGIRADVPVVCMIARYHPVKDHAMFFRAVTQIMNKNSDVHFVLAGRNVCEENPFFYQLKVSMPFPDNIYLLGERTDVEAILSIASVVVNCSKSEAFPISVAEAMACGVACVVTDVGDSTYLLGGYGQVVSSEDAGALAEAVLSLLLLSNKERDSIGCAASDRIKNMFSIQSVTEQYNKLYQRNTGSLV